VADLIRDRDLSAEKAIYKGDGLDLIPATPYLARVEREMVGMTNSELRLMRKLSEVRDRYSAIIIDTPPTFGPLMNAALNTAGHLIVPVDSAFFALMGIKELLSEVEEIKQGTNPALKILGFLMTMVDPTNISHETRSSLVANFGTQVFETCIRRSVKLREAPALGKTIFHHAQESAGAQDYWSLATEVMERLGIGVQAERSQANQSMRPTLALVREACHE
jgi:chromosome partitioning protein